MDAIYFGARPKHGLTRRMDQAGHRVIHAQYKKGILASLTGCGAVVLHWRSQRDQQIIEDAKAAGLRSMVITKRLDDAYTAGEPLADLYLEEPAREEDVAALLIDLMQHTEQPTGGRADKQMGLAA